MLKILNQSAQLQALVKTSSANINEEINREFTFSFSAIIDGDKSVNINTDNMVEVEDNYFNIMYTNEKRHSDGTMTVKAECEHISYTLIEDELENGFTGLDTPTNLLTSLFSGTSFTVGTVNFTDPLLVSINEKTNKRGVLLYIANLLGGELKFSKYEVSILTRRGADRGVQFRYRKNNISVSREVDKRKLISGQPTVSYDVDVGELEFANGYDSDEHYELGDTVQVIDPGLNINTPQRIVRESHDPFDRMKGNVTIANFISDLGDSFVTLQQRAVMKENIYNGCKIGPENGFVATRSDNKVKSTLNATEGISIKKGDGTGNTWNDVWYVDVDGNLHMKDGYIELIRSDVKIKIIIDPANGMKIQKNTGTVGTPVWTDVNYQDVDGNTILQGFIIASKFFGATKDSAFIEIGTAGGGNLGDLKLFRGTGGGSHPVFSVYDNLTIVDFKAGTGGSAPVIFISVSPTAAYPKNLWDCSNAEFAELSDGTSFYALQSWVSDNFAPISHSHTT